ncbi:MAG TPA: tetratricopeptide repeat protein [Candidatus Sulfotelmatobacter sp.]|jgi:tetratricopeptide (TPR) repeat protein
MLKRLAGACFRFVVLCIWTASLAHAAGADQFEALVKRAFELHQQGNFSAAMPLLRRAYAMQPDDYFVNLLLGIDSLRVGEPGAALPYLKRASRLRPSEEYPFSYLGEAYARQRAFAEAESSYMKAVDIAPASGESSIAFVDFALSRFADISTALRSSSRGLAQEYRLRARAIEWTGSARIPLLQRAADLDPHAPGIWSELAEASVQSRDWTAAEGQMQRARAADPEDLSAWIVDAQLAAHSGDWKHANERLNAVARRSTGTLSRAAAQWPKELQPPADILTGVVGTFFRCVREGQAVCNIQPLKADPGRMAELFREQRWEEITKLAPPPATATKPWLQRGIAYAELDDCEHAIPALERGVIGTNPDVNGMFQLSWCYSQQAGRIAQRVQQSSENEASLHTMRGDILLRLQAKPDLAVEEYRQALVQNDRDPSVLDRLAEAQFGAGKVDAARASADAALRIDPHRLGAMRTLAKIAIQNRDYNAALPYLKELAERNPNDVAGRVELGKAYAQTGALKEAREDLTPALEHGYPDEKGTLHYLLGTVLKKLGQNSEAELAFSEASQLSDAFQQKSYHDQDPDGQP